MEVKHEETTKSNPVEDALSLLTETLRRREKELEAREEKLREAQEAFERERYDVYGDTTPSDVLHLNVGGKKTVVLRRTLTTIPGSMLASRFSGRWDDSIETDKDGNFVIDQPFDLFEPLIDYLRNRSNGTEIYPMDSPYFEHVQQRNFYRLVDYYGLTHGIYPTRLELLYGSQNDVEQETPWKVNAKEWTAFKLVKDGHSRSAKTYELVLSSVQRIQIGWQYTSKDVDFATGNKLGVGDVENTSAIDLSRSCYLADGINTAIEGLEHEPGTVVRCEEYGQNWYLNGKLVATTSEARENGVVQSSAPGRWKKSSSHESYQSFLKQCVCPVISVKGEFKITTVEFMD